MEDPVQGHGHLCHEPCAWSDDSILATASEQGIIMTDLLPHECLGEDRHSCPDLNKPSVGCCSQDACPTKCLPEHLRAALMADGHTLNVKMARAESTTEEPTKTVSSSSRPRQTSSPDSTRTARSTSYTRTFTASTTPTSIPTTTPTITTPQINSTETSPAHTAQDSSLTTTQTIGISVGASIVGLFLLGCLIHRILVYIRKRRPGYPHLTDHAPDWHPPVSPVELTEVVAPGTRQCGFGRIPGEATRPSSWEDKGNNEAEVKLGGVAPRRVKSEGPSGLLCASPDSFEHEDNGKVYDHRAPLRVTNDRSTRYPLSVRMVGSSANSIYEHQGGQLQTEPSSHASSLRGPNTWITGGQHTTQDGIYPSQGDYTVNIDRHSQIHRARPTHSAGELRRHTAPYNPAVRSDDQLNRLVSYPAGEQRPAPRSDGAGRVLSLGQYPLRTYEAYTPPDSEPTRQNTQTSGTTTPNVQREVHELAGEPVGEVRDPRARVTLGDVYVVNPDPANDVSIMSEAVKDELQDGGGEAMSEAPVIVESHSANGAQRSVDKEPVANTAGDDTDKMSGEKIEEGDKESIKCGKDQISHITSRPQSPVGAFRAAAILCSIATSNSAQKLDEPSSQDTSTPPPFAPTVPSPDNAPRLDATGGVPLPHLMSSRPSSISSTAQDSRPSATGTPRRHSGIPSSSTAPTSLASKPQTEASGLRPEDVPRMLAAPRRRASELHMDIPADDGLGYASHPRVAQLERQRQYTDRYASPPGYNYHDRPSDYGTRYPTYPASQPRAQQHNTTHIAPRPAHQHPPAPQQPQPYTQAHHTRVVYPHHAHPPRLMASPPANTTERPRRTAEQLGLGPQPRPAYRTPEGAVDLNRGNNIARREVVSGTYKDGCYLRVGGHGYAASSDGGYIEQYSGEYSGQYSPAVPRNEYFHLQDEGWDYEQGSTGSAQGSFSSRTWQS